MTLGNLGLRPNCTSEPLFPPSSVYAPKNKQRLHISPNRCIIFPDIMKIYFAGSIRGGRDDAGLYQRLIALLSEHGTVLTEHVGSEGLSPTGEDALSDEEIYTRDMAWLADADAIVAEVTTPSHGVGYEVAQARARGKPVLCIYRPSAGRRLSAMLAGDPALQCESYESLEQLEPILARFLSTIP